MKSSAAAGSLVTQGTSGVVIPCGCASSPTLSGMIGGDAGSYSTHDRRAPGRLLRPGNFHLVRPSSVL
jgi:hypothetical protein